MNQLERFNPMFLNILLPVYNEEKRLQHGVIGTIDYLQSIGFSDYIVTIVDNGSTDKTSVIAKELEKTYDNVNYLQLSEQGVGVAFKKGVEHNDCEIVGYMDIDLSTDVHHLKDVITIFKSHPEIDMINGSRLNKKSDTNGRKWYRNITSHGLTFMLKIFLKLKASDSICGFKFFRKEVIEKLITQTSHNNGWFYVIEILLRAEKQNYTIYEMPVRWTDDYNTTVHVFKLIRNYVSNIFRLRKLFKKEHLL